MIEHVSVAGERAAAHPGRWLLAAAILVTAVGCAPRTITITQDPHVNTYMHRKRDPAKRTGEPLDVTIVCVYPKDLDRKDKANNRLAPGSGITCKEWYERRPLRGDRPDSEDVHDRFRLPPEQIYLLTDSDKFYGQQIGPALGGAERDGPKVVRGGRKGIEFNALALHDRRSVIYVFPKFSDGEKFSPETGKGVLPVPPAIFCPPGAYTRSLYVHIGVRNPGGANPEQYIENTTSQGLSGGQKEP